MSLPEHSAPLELAAYFSPEPGVQTLFGLARQALDGGARSLLLLAADANDISPVDVDAWLGACPVPVFGGVFPQLIHGERNYSTGYLVVGLSQPVEVIAIPGLSLGEHDHTALLESQLGTRQSTASVMLLVDGMASGISALLDSLYDILGSDPVVFGGGAGSLSFTQKPCLFFNEGLREDHAQITLLGARLRLAVEHGWEKFAGPFLVTEADRTELKSLDFQPAYGVYRDIVEADTGLRFTDHDFFEIAKGYPFGMERPAGDLVVRDPVTRSGGSLICVGEVPVNSVVYLLKGQPDNLVRAAGRGAQRIGRGAAPVIVTDCISRVLYLGEHFSEELAAVGSHVAPGTLLGMLTLGEIANGGEYCLEFYNKTLVLAALGD